MGIFSLGPRWVRALFELAFAARLPSTLLEAVESSLVNFDFYLECVMASVPGQELSGYLDRMHGSGSKLCEEDLTLMHRHFAPLELRGAMVTDAIFLHFGTLTEYPDSCMQAALHGMLPVYVPSEVGHSSSGLDDSGIVMINNSRVGGAVSAKRVPGETVSAVKSIAWVEGCINCDFCLPHQGFNLIVHCNDLHFVDPLPEGLCLDGRRFSAPVGSRLGATAEGCACCVYSTRDTFKEQKTEDAVIFCGVPMPQWLADRGLTPADIWDASALPGLDLWSARLFCIRPADVVASEAAGEYAARLAGYWDVASFDKLWFTGTTRLSLKELGEWGSVLERDGYRMRCRTGKL